MVKTTEFNLNAYAPGWPIQYDAKRLKMTEFQVNGYSSESN